MKRSDKTEMRPEYDLSNGVRGKYYKQYTTDPTTYRATPESVKRLARRLSRMIEKQLAEMTPQEVAVAERKLQQLVSRTRARRLK